MQVRRAVKWQHLEAQFIRDHARLGQESMFLIHFRIKTHGDVNKANCHPFRMVDGGAFIHNGIIPIVNIPADQSDTRYFVSKILDHLPRGWQYDIEWIVMVEEMIGSFSKAVALWPNMSYYIFGESKGHWEDNAGLKLFKADDEEKLGKVWYSNSSCSLPTQYELDRRAGKAHTSDWHNPHGVITYPKVPMLGSPGNSGDGLPRSTNSPTRPFGVSTNPNMIQTGPHTYRVRTEAERALLREETAAQDEVERLASLSDDELEVECIDNMHMCPKCGSQHSNRQSTFLHFKDCTRFPIFSRK